MLSYRIIDTGARELGGDDTVFLIQRALQAHGYSVFVGEAALQGGQKWGQRIQAAVNNCEVFVALCSPDYGNTEVGPKVVSRPVMPARQRCGGPTGVRGPGPEGCGTFREFQLADFKKKPILPVWHSGQYPPAALEIFLSGLQRVPQGGKCLKETAFDEAMRQILSCLQREGCHPKYPRGAAPAPASNPASASASGPAHAFVSSLPAEEQVATATTIEAPLSSAAAPAHSTPHPHPHPHGKPGAHATPHKASSRTSLPPLAPLTPAPASAAARASPSPPPPPAPVSLRDPSYQKREGARPQAARTPEERSLLQAVDAGNAAAVARALADPRANPNVTGGPAGKTALALAAEGGDERVVEALLRGGADPTVEDSYGKTPLHVACAKGHRGVTLLLLRAGADPGARTSAGDSPLLDACRSGAAEVVELVLKGGGDPCDTDNAGRSALHCAGSGAVAAALLQAGAATGAKDKETGATPLLAACRWGNLEVAQALLGAGADLGARDIAGKTPLHHATTTDMAAALLRAGADHAARDNDGFTPLHAACHKGLAGVARALLEAGADKGTVDEWGKTPLALAKQRGHPEVAALLEGWKR
ncbi:hypothetical protein HYH03_013622 [Edaphochlamys debaryana]|uniref:TIR domain-containing protein n=1 Tax=Edaphochlamys debaryana TaxID=47281 RepID=A0A835XRU1_9CHLO|nr:hypothetical protein HYH03_013622 [Edaphochlamys debaryana]|eukprot:KAG2487778.1 hypothetical protein HYH03_013622 [Edaphochlamys debaryana]